MHDADSILTQHTFPENWQNPEGGNYDLVCLGGGPAGLMAAVVAVTLGGKVALVERRGLGGDCLHHGCIPSKALIVTARRHFQCHAASDLRHDRSTVDCDSAFDEVRTTRAEFGRHDSAARLSRKGIDVFLGSGRFIDRRSLKVGDRRLFFRRCIIATGSEPACPSIPGLTQVPFHTSRTVFSLPQIPSGILVVGGGPVGCELAQAFRRLGSQVWLITRGPLLPREDATVSAVIASRFDAEGIDVFTNSEILRVSREGDQTRLEIRTAQLQRTLKAEALLVATGRSRSLDDLRLNCAGVGHSAQGIQVNDRLQTANPRIYAAGDCIGQQAHTHAADAMARICVQNAFFWGRKRLSQLVIPRTTFTDPEVAHVGLTRRTARQRGITADHFREDFRRIDRSVLEREQTGFAEIHCRHKTGHILGASIVGPRAGELIGVIALMISNRIPLRGLAKTIQCYPTHSGILKALADRYTRSRLTPARERLLRFLIQRS